MQMTVAEFLAACKLRGWHFTVNWVTKRVRQLEEERS